MQRKNRVDLNKLTNHLVLCNSCVTTKLTAMAMHSTKVSTFKLGSSQYDQVSRSICQPIQNKIEFIHYFLPLDCTQ